MTVTRVIAIVKYSLATLCLVAAWVVLRPQASLFESLISAVFLLCALAFLKD